MVDFACMYPVHCPYLTCVQEGGWDYSVVSLSLVSRLIPFHSQTVSYRVPKTGIGLGNSTPDFIINVDFSQESTA